MQAVNNSATVQDLVPPSKAMFKQVAALVMPKLRIEYASLDMPQDMLLNQEEQKVQLTSD